MTNSCSLKYSLYRSKICLGNSSHNLRLYWMFNKEKFSAVTRSLNLQDIEQYTSYTIIVSARRNVLPTHKLCHPSREDRWACRKEWQKELTEEVLEQWFSPKKIMQLMQYFLLVNYCLSFHMTRKYWKQGGYSYLNSSILNQVMHWHKGDPFVLLKSSFVTPRNSSYWF